MSLRWLILLPLCLAAGCSESVEPLPASTVEVPPSFASHGTLWTELEMTPADESLLTRFFEKHQDLAGSPDMEGEPIVFGAGAMDRRFYWLKPAASGVTWTSVSFEKGQLGHADGAGSPF